MADNGHHLYSGWYDRAVHMIEVSEKLKSTAENKASRMANSPVLSNNPTVFYLLVHSSSRTRSAALVSPNLFSSAALCLQSELLFLIMNFFQVLNSKNGIHRMKNHTRLRIIVSTFEKGFRQKLLSVSTFEKTSSAIMFLMSTFEKANQK